MMKFDKSKAGMGCDGTLFGTHLFSKEMVGILDELVWGFLRNGMKIHPHKHPQNEVYIFIKGEGTMQVDDEIMPVKDGDIILVPSNSMHTAWNNIDTDLEFILVRTRKIGSWIIKLMETL